MSIRACKYCSQNFESQRNKDYCSRTHKELNKRKRQEELGIVQFNKSKPYIRKRIEQVKERDQWICQICKTEVTKDLHFLDMMAYTVDHIIPTSLGGNHDLDNLQLAHRICNIKKSNKIER